MQPIKIPSYARDGKLTFKNMDNYKPIPGFNNHSISSVDGSVLNTKTGTVLSPQLINSGYHAVHIFENTVRKAKTVHRLVATTFISNPESKLFVNHKDGNKLNNALSNLEWSTHSENMKHAFATGLSENTRKKSGERLSALGKMYCKERERFLHEKNERVSRVVLQLTMEGVKINEFKSIRLAERTVGAANIHKVLSGKFTHSAGFKWEYKKD